MISDTFRLLAVYSIRCTFANVKRSLDHYIMNNIDKQSPTNGHLQAKNSNLEDVENFQVKIYTTQELKELFGDAFSKKKVSRETENQLFNDEKPF